MKADLHVHSSQSDGSLTVDEVLLRASKNGIEWLALTDHDTTSGVQKALKPALSYGIRIIPALELTTFYRDEEIHLLGYYKDVQNDFLQDTLKKIRQERVIIAQKMVIKLRDNGMPLVWDEIEAMVPRDGSVCKGHIMYALSKLTPDIIQAKGINYMNMISWFRPGGIAYIPNKVNPYKEAVDMIFATGGLPVLAHPGLILNKHYIQELLSYRAIGLEVYYGYWYQRDENIAFFKKISEDSAVLSTGGSDFHGPFSQVGLGEEDVPDKCVRDLRNYLQIE